MTEKSPVMRALAAILLFVSGIKADAETADRIFISGNVYTVNEKHRHAEAIAVHRDRIIFVGTNADAEKFRADKTHIVDLAGKTVTPGFTDSHCHIFGIGEREMTLNLEGTNTREDFLAKVRERVAQTERDKWITGRGWIETFWKPPQFPTRDDLDKIAPDNPVFLTRADGHAALANSAALKIAAVTRETANPFGGEILKDPRTGESTGMLLDNAMDLVAKNIPPPSEAEREQALLIGIKREIELGWCEIQNAGSELSDQEIIRRAYAAGKVKLRMVNAAYGPGEAANELLKKGATLNAFDHRFTQRTIKVIFDGALGSRGAALLAPYSDKPDSSGFLTQKPEELRPMFEEALRRGIQVETHAIGDRANRLILDLYEAAFKAVPPEKRNVLVGGASYAEPSVAAPRPPKLDDGRWRADHAQISNEKNFPPCDKLNTIV